jgi:serine/threonine protein kinase
MYSSNGSSKVLVCNTEAYQYFERNSVAKRIYAIISSLGNKCIYNCKLGTFYPRKIIFSATVEYDISDYIVPIRRTNFEENLLIWEKVKPLSEITNISNFIETNIIKLLWDIGKSLYGLHSKGWVHNDCRIDNIGISTTGNFILYDFDGTVELGERGKWRRRDYITFAESITYVTEKYRLSDLPRNVGEGGNLIIALIRHFYDTKGSGTVDWLENLKITYI